MKSAYLAAAAAGLFAGVASAQMGAQVPNPMLNHVDGYYIAIADLEVSAPTVFGTQSFDDDGDGFGFKGRAQPHDNLFINAEYQMAETDDNDIEVEQIRAGAGFFAPMTRTTGLLARGEYIRADVDDDDEDGFGFFGGGQVELIEGFFIEAEAGYVDIGDFDGPEFRVGGRFLFTPNIALFVDYRSARLEDGDTDLDVDDLRVGAGFHF